MKVLMINHFPLAGSGSGTYTKNLAVHLAQLGHEVCVILPENTDDFERVPGIRLRPVYHTAGADFGPAAGGREADAGDAQSQTKQTGGEADAENASSQTAQTGREADAENAPSQTIQSGQDAVVAAESARSQNSERLGATLDDALPFNFPCFTSHPRSVTTFADLDEAQMAQYTRAFTAAIEEEIEANRPDVIHGQHVWILPALAAGRGIPLVLTAHGTDLMGYDKWPALRSYAETAMDACSAVISISKDNCALIEERFPQHRDKVVMMRNGYDPGVFYPENVTRDEVLSAYAAKDVCGSGVGSDINAGEDSGLIGAGDRVAASKDDDPGADANVPDMGIEPGANANAPDTGIEPGADANVPDMGIEPGADANVPDMGIEPGAWRGKKIVSFAGKLAHFKGVDVLLDAVSLIESQASRQPSEDADTQSQASRQTDKDADTQGQASRKPSEDAGTQSQAAGISDNSIPEMLVLIVGDGDERDALHAQAKKLGLKTVRFLGNVDQQALCRLYNIADVSLVPSRREPFGLVAIEAMACGIPVIATNQGGLPDFVNDSVGALCAPEDAEDLARTILATLAREARTDMPAWRAEIAHYARTHYAQDTIIRELESLYERAVETAKM